MADEVDEWISAQEALQLVMHLYRDAQSPEVSAVIALRDRLAEGSLRAHCSAYTFENGGAKLVHGSGGLVLLRAV